MSLAMKARQKAKRKGAPKDRVFGCDLVEHLQLSGHEVPQVLKSCTEFVEEHGLVDGIYRVSGVSSNIQKLRLEFDTDCSPDLNKKVYLQDIHCVSSLCKAYFRELPNPLLTYQLYDKFADAVNIQLEEGRLVKIKEVLKELPSPHYRTLEFLMRHLVHMASYSPQTNMHVRNLAIVWAPNLLRSKDIETSGFNGTAAFMEVRIQSIVVEFILTHVEQLFGDAPLTAGSRETIRKSLLLMESPMALAEEKYCISYNVPAMLNQGDGPPQMRPYHTIIELTDSKKKGSLKAKRWKSIFNLGRAMHDGKRKSSKMEDKDEKAKMRLRPAKSMDSLSSMPCTIDGDVQLGRKKSQKQLTSCRESFDGPASLDSCFLVSGECPEKVKGDEPQGESEGEATAKSEPTTPKASRSGLVGVARPGRSPKTGQNRAEKCAGVHITGPLSVTVPFHITNNLTLSRLTRGLECPALNHCSVDHKGPEGSLAKEDEACEEKGGEPTLASGASDEPTEVNIESLLDLEENRISLEVQDSFSFLDSQDAWLGDGPDGDYPWKGSRMAFDPTDSGVDGFVVLEDDLGSAYMNEMIGGDTQFSAAPRMDYLSIEECMNELSDEGEDQYFLASTGGLDTEDPSKEVDSEEVYMSAFDDLSPLAAELEHLQEFAGSGSGALEGPMEDQAFCLMGETSPGDPTGFPKFEASPQTPPGDLPDFATSLPNPEFSSPSKEEEGVAPGTGLETVLNNEREEESSLCMSEGQVTSARDDLLLPLEDLLLEGDLNAVLEETHRSLGCDKETIQPSLEDGGKQHQSGGSCDPNIGADDSTPEMVGMFDEHADYEYADCGFSPQEMLQSEGMIDHLPAGEASSWVESPTSLGAEVPSLVGSETASSDCPPMPAPLFVQSPAHDVPCVPLPDGYSDSNTLFSVASSSNHCPPWIAWKVPLAEASVVSKQVLSDGSVHMRLTANTTRIQHAKSFPVVAPKPQFARVPPFLTPKTPTEDASDMWPDPPIPNQNGGDGVTEESGEGSATKPPRPLSLDTYRSPRGHNTPVAIFPAPSEMEGCGSPTDSLVKQRNSMPVSLEKYGQDCDEVCRQLDRAIPRFRMQATSSTGTIGDPQRQQDSLPESLQKDGVKGDGGRGEPPHKEPGPGFLATPQKQRQTAWRNGSSMSFDEAVALAKERQMTQAAPMRRMQTYCYGDAEGKPPPHPKPVLKPLGQRPLRPLSCLGTAVTPEALLSGKPFFAQVLTDVPMGRPLTPTPEAFPQDLLPQRRLSLPKIGRRLSLSEEVPGATPQERW